MEKILCRSRLLTRPVSLVLHLAALIGRSITVASLSCSPACLPFLRLSFLSSSVSIAKESDARIRVRILHTIYVRMGVRLYVKHRREFVIMRMFMRAHARVYLYMCSHPCTRVIVHATLSSLVDKRTHARTRALDSHIPANIA